MRLISVTFAVSLLRALAGCGTEPYKSSKDAPETFDDVAGGDGGNGTGEDNGGGDAGVTVTSGTTTFTESGSGDFTVVLNSRPSGLTLIQVTTQDDTEVLLSDGGGATLVIGLDLVFDSSTWSEVQTVTLTGVEDQLLDGDQLVTVSVDMDTRTTDEDYILIDPDDVAVVVLDNDELQGWQVLSGMPSSHYRSTTAASSGSIYVMGGLLKNDLSYVASDIVEMYDPGSDTWTTTTPIPIPRFGFAATDLNNIIYLIGGYTKPENEEFTGTAIGTVDAYDITKNIWLSKSSLPSRNWAVAAVAINGKIYTIGGGPGITLEIYDPATDIWSEGSSIPTPRSGFAAAEVNGEIFVVGGDTDYGSGSGVTGALENYNPENDTWTIKRPMPTPRSNLSVTSMNGVIYVFGGQNGDNVGVDAVEAYDPAADTWSTKTSSPQTVSLHSSVSVNGIIYVIGRDTMWAYDPSEDQ